MSWKCYNDQSKINHNFRYESWGSENVRFQEKVVAFVEALKVCAQTCFGVKFGIKKHQKKKQTNKNKKTKKKLV